MSHTRIATTSGANNFQFNFIRNSPYYFKTKIAKKMLEGEEYQVIDADQNPEMVRKFGIMQAPTLVVFDGDKMHKYVNASNIQRYVDQM